MITTSHYASMFAAMLLVVACNDVPSTPAAEAHRTLAARVKRGDPVLVGAGDIAQCYQPDNPTQVTPPQLTGAESTAVLLDAIPGP
jgi:hypothetical protein